MQTFLSLKGANQQIFGLILFSQMRKFLGCASPQITIPQFFFDNLQIANSQILLVF
jgi:hypothetical protein